MAIKRPRGDAVAVAQVTKITKPASGGAITFAINGKYLSFGAWEITTIVDTWNPETDPIDAVAEAPEFDEITASASGNDLILTADIPGRPFQVSALVGTQDATNAITDEVQLVTLGNSPTGGTFTLTFAGQTTAGIAYNASAATVQAALEALSNIGVSEALVTGNAGGPWSVRFAGTLADTDQPLMTGSGASLTGGTAAVTIATLADGAAGTNEVQTVTLNGSPTGGTFTLTFAGQTTGAIARNASAATVQTALEALSTIGSGNVACTGGALPATVTCTFQGALAKKNLPQMTGNGAALTGSTLTATVTETTPGVTGQNLKIDVSVPTAYGASAQWRFQWVDGATTYEATTTITPNSSAAQITAALESIPVIGIGNVQSVSTTPWLAGYNAWRVEFIAALAGVNSVTSNWTKLRLAYVSGSTQIGDVRLNQAATGTNEVQTIAIAGTPTAGSFTLTFGGQTTAAIAYNASAATVQSALQALSTIGTGGVTCGGGALPGANVTVTFSGNGLQTTNVALLTIDAGNLNPAVTTTVDGVNAANELQTVTITGAPFGGTLTLTVGANTTSALAYNAAAATVQAALEALASVGAGKVVCTGGPFPATIYCQFDPTLGNLGQMTATPTLHNGTVTIAESVKGGIAVGVTEQTRSQGPEHWDDPRNWSPEGIPDSADTVALDSGSAELLYGLEQRSTFTADAATDVLTLASNRKTFQNGQKVRVRNSGGGLPGGLAAVTDYYVINAGVSGGMTTDNRLQLSATLGGPAINITSAGTGTHTMAVVLTEIRAPSRWSGKLGLPQRDEGETWEYRPLSLQIDVAVVTIGLGPGNGTGRFRLDTDTAACAFTVYDTGGTADIEGYAVEWVGSNAANTYDQINGECGIACRENQSANLASITLRGGTLELGPAVTAAALKRTEGTLIAGGAVVSGPIVLQE